MKFGKRGLYGIIASGCHCLYCFVFGFCFALFLQFGVLFWLFGNRGRMRKHFSKSCVLQQNYLCSATSSDKKLPNPDHHCNKWGVQRCFWIIPLLSVIPSLLPSACKHISKGFSVCWLKLTTSILKSYLWWLSY